MKAYTLRIDDELLNKIKYIALEENKNIREILLELLENKVKNFDFPKASNTKNKKLNLILNKIPDNDILKIIRDDRGR